MNTKTLIILFTAGIVVVVGASIVLLKAKNSQKQSGIITQALKEDKNLNNLNYLATQGKVLPVTLSESGALPPSIKLNKGEAINFTNSTKQDSEIRVTGTASLYVIKIPAGKSQISPIFTMGGTFKFQDKNNPKIKGEIVVK